MGFFDSIKRWRLAREGLSSGKKRRVHLENPIIQALEESGLIKFSLYAMFAVLCAVLVVRSSDGILITNTSIKSALCGFAIAVMAILMFHVSFQASCQRNSRVILVLGGLIGHLLVAQMMMKFGDAQLSRFLLVPFALAPMLHGVLLGRAVASFSAIFVTLIGCLLVPQAEIVSYMIFSFISGMTGVLAGYQVRRRLQLLQAGFYVGAVTLMVGLILGRLDVAPCFGPDSMEHLKVLGMGSAAAFATAVATVIIISGLLPIFEGVFHLTTDISWLELSDLNHKLLRQMQLEAPGTFHHSLIVAALAEAAAEKIGANAPMCRVCSYFHDVGKLKKPNYFIENQHDGAENPHDNLTPTMSAMIIIAHVKDGVDLAVKNKLNPRIIDVIQEHHGDSLVHYFYRRAQEQKKQRWKGRPPVRKR
ncbi:MAG: HDIG domain-containing protein [Akkermansiaceae bacterium]|nr:HDIG domain-containing protein [Akkermansiaceae bacterium]